MTRLTTARPTIPHTKLDRMTSDINYHWSGRPRISRFGYDHGHTLVWDDKGKCDLLIDRESNPFGSDVARLLQHCSPDMMRELVRGYRLAKVAGILGDGERPIEEVDAVYEDHDTGDMIYQAIKKAQRKPGGYDV